MRKIRLIFDFDGTITTRDTTRFLMYELLRSRPWKAIFVAKQAIGLLRQRSPEAIQTCKLRCIGVAIEGLSEHDLLPSLQRFARTVRRLYRPELLRLIEEHSALGDDVVLASASPGFALRHLFAEYRLSVVATEFEVRHGVFTGRAVGNSCFGAHKAAAVLHYLSLAGDESVESSWSDSISDLPVMMLARNRIWYCSAVDELKLRKVDPEGCFVVCQ